MNILFVCRGAEVLGVEYLSSVLKRGGHKTELVFDPGLEDNLYFKNPFMKEFSLDNTRLKKIKKFKPDLIAASSVTSTYYKVKQLSLNLKRIFGVPLIVGGVHATALPKMVLKDSFDMVCRGEGEEALLELVNKMEGGRNINKTKNIWFIKRNGKIIRNRLRPLIKDLDSLPFPDKDLFYKYGAFKDTLHVITGRGCPFKCTYCFNHYYQKIYKGKGAYVRRRSVDNVIAEIISFKKKYNVKFVEFLDDTFTLNHKWVENFCKKYDEKVGLPFRILTHPTAINKKMVGMLKIAGCRDIAIGLESGDPKIRKKILCRNVSDEKILKAAKIIKEVGINLHLFTMFGIPSETTKEMWKTIEMIRKIKPKNLTTSVFCPFPKTTLANYSLKKKLVDENSINNPTSGYSIYRKSPLRHPYAKEVNNILIFLPIANRLPFLYSMFKKIYKQNFGITSYGLHLISMIVRNPSCAMYKFREYLAMWMKL